MVLDTSALVAVLRREPESALFLAEIEADPVTLISVASVLETTIVLQRQFGADAVREFEVLLARVTFDVRPVDSDQLHWAQHAFRHFGRGHHAAGLNFGDCFSYALSRASGEPLLYKGDDFRRTDVHSVL